MFLQRIRKLENKKSRLTKLHFSWISKNCETVKFDLSMQKSFIIGFRSNRSFLDMIHSKLWRSDLHLFDMIQSKKNINQKKFRISLSIFFALDHTEQVVIKIILIQEENLIENKISNDHDHLPTRHRRISAFLSLVRKTRCSYKSFKILL